MDIKKNNFWSICLVVFLLAFFLRYFNNFYEGFWSDEILTLIISNPFIDQKEMVKNWLQYDGSPIIYFFFLKYFFYFLGFTPENARLFSIIFSISTVFLSIIFFKIRYQKELLLSSVFFLAINIFLIWQAKEARIPSSVSFFSMLNIIYFYYFLKNQTKLNFIILFLFNFFLISYYPFAVTILSTQYIYLIFLSKNLKKFFIYSIYYLATILLYIYINLDYIILHGSRDLGHIGVINYKFFFNYFFSSYFGSYFFGGFCLILFILVLIKNLVNKRNIKDIIYFHIILILNTYIFLILYTFFKTEIAVPRYFIFLIPSIIFVIMDIFKFKNIKFFLFLFLITAMINTLVCLAKGRIPKPPIKNLISQLSTENSNIILHVEDWFNIYLDNLDLLKKNYKIIKKTDVDRYNKIWFVCFNNIRADRGNIRIEDEKKCRFNLENFTKEKIINIPDFKIILFSKIN